LLQNFRPDITAAQSSQNILKQIEHFIRVFSS